MATRSVSQLPLVVIVGPTASGKTALAIEVALRQGGEIICADSRTVFKEMNIGTAKPTPNEQAQVPHHGIDLTEPGKRFTAAEYKVYANQKISEIRSRGKVPILVGGTGLYIDGIIFDYDYPRQASREELHKLESMSSQELAEYCLKNNIELPFNDKNKRHLIRNIIHNGIRDSRRSSVIPNTYIYGIVVEKSTLRQRIAGRTEHMFANGVVDEATNLGKKYGWDSESMLGNIYPLVRELILGKVTLEEAKDAFRIRDWQLAKRQMTWFRRNPQIAWGTPEDIQEHINNVFALE